jgi:RNA polymerase sigma-70 factor, ECF subfamily
MLENLKDKWLVEQFLLFRSESAFNKLYKRHSQILYRVALQVANGETQIAEDLVQNTWLKAIQKLLEFRWESSLRTWLIGILIYTGKEYLRNFKSFEMVDEGNQKLAQEKSIANQIDLENALSKLPSGYRVVLVLHDIEGYKHTEISEILGIHEGTSKSQLFHARKMMKNYLNN